MILHHAKKSLIAASLLIAFGAGGSFAIAQLHGNKLLSVQTKSMVPVIKRGDLVSVKPVPDSQLRVGDIVTYIKPTNNKQTITHRIVQLPNVANKHMFITKGDANAVADPPVPANKIVGKVSMNLPYAGFLVDFLHKPVGLALLIWIPALVIILGEYQKLYKYYSRARPYTSLTLKGRQKNEGWGTGGVLILSSKLTLGAMFISIFLALPVYALFTSKVTLSNTSIFTGPISPPVEGPHVTFRKIVMRCSASNTVSKNVRPLIVIQNWTHQNFTANGWSVADNNGTIFNIPNGFEFKKLRQYRFTPLLADGLQYSGDRLVIKNGQGQTVDALSWGSDTTAFTPSIQNVTSGDRLERRPFNVDTDVASDWRVFDHRCWCPDQPDVEDGSDEGEFGDSNESNRASTPGTYNLEELQ